MHPFVLCSGFRRYRRDRRQCNSEVSTRTRDDVGWEGGPGSIVGVGFCLKPLDPACPSGRANHDCLFIEGLANGNQACVDCSVRRLGSAALKAGSAFYIMTSAQDILRDLLLPSLCRNEYTRALLALCRYSIEPFRFALTICGVDSRMAAFASGDCRDFATWRKADKGHKKEQTTLCGPTLDGMLETLAAAALGDVDERRFRKNGGVFICHSR
jgi:hypothetical protein